MSLADRLVVKRGELYALLFENPPAGVGRAVFLTVIIEFEAFDVQGTEFHPQLMAEWLPWRGHDWRALHGQVWEWSTQARRSGGEASFYTVEHDEVVQSRIELRRQQGSTFEIDWRAVVDYQGFTGDDAEPRMRVHANVGAAFDGILISGDIVPGEAGLELAARRAVAPFVDVNAFAEVELKRGAFGLVNWWLSP